MTSFSPLVRPWMTGRCYEFALALAERIDGGEFAAIGSADEPEHVAIRKNGVFYDARGPIAEEAAFLDGRQDPAVVVARDVVELHAGAAGDAPPYRGNRDVAEARRAIKAIFGPKFRLR